MATFAFARKNGRNKKIERGLKMNERTEKIKELSRTININNEDLSRVRENYRYLQAKYTRSCNNISKQVSLIEELKKKNEHLTKMLKNIYFHIYKNVIL